MENQVIFGDCSEKLLEVPDNHIQVCITSPPYAEQRSNLYDSINEADYPAWTVKWMAALKPKLKPDGSVLVVIRPHIRNGQISDYVLQTRLALRKDGWNEAEELIWHKPDAPPLGSCKRPRRTWESILWFTKQPNPFVNLKACGNANSQKTGCFVGSNRFGDGVVVAKRQNREKKAGTSRVPDVFVSKISEIAKGVMHPAVYPQTLTDQLVATFSKEGDLVLDPFSGSGTTLLSALTLDRKYLGFDTNLAYVELAKTRLVLLFSKKAAEIALQTPTFGVELCMEAEPCRPEHDFSPS